MLVPRRCGFAAGQGAFGCCLFGIVFPVLFVSQVLDHVLQSELSCKFSKPPTAVAHCSCTDLPVRYQGLFWWFFSVFGLRVKPFGGQPGPVLLILPVSSCDSVVSIVIIFTSVLFAVNRARSVILQVCVFVQKAFCAIILIRITFPMKTREIIISILVCGATVEYTEGICP